MEQDGVVDINVFADQFQVVERRYSMRQHIESPEIPTSGRAIRADIPAAAITPSTRPIEESIPNHTEGVQFVAKYDPIQIDMPSSSKLLTPVTTPVTTPLRLPQGNITIESPIYGKITIIGSPSPSPSQMHSTSSSISAITRVAPVAPIHPSTSIAPSSSLSTSIAPSSSSSGPVPMSLYEHPGHIDRKGKKEDIDRKGKKEALTSSQSGTIYNGNTWVSKSNTSTTPTRSNERRRSAHKSEMVTVVAPPALLKKSSSDDGEQSGELTNVEMLINEIGNAQGKKTNVQYYPRRTFSINDDKYVGFWNGYCSLVNNSYSNKHLSLGENIDCNNVPLTIDVCLTFDGKPSSYTSTDYGDFAVALVGICQDAILTHVNVNDKKSELAAIMLHSDICQITRGGYMVHFRIQFPYARVSVRFINQVILQNLRGDIPSILEFLGEIRPNNADNMVFSPFFSNTLPLYHSKIRRTDPILTFYRAFGEIPSDIIDGGMEDFDTSELDLKLDEVFPLFLHSYVVSGTIDVDALEPEDVEPEYWLPYIMSVNYWTSASQVHTLISPGPGTPQQQEVEVEHVIEEEKISDDDPMYMARQLLPMISINRYKVEHSWSAIGEALNAVSGGNDEGLQWWIRQTMAAGIYEEENCEDKWEDWNNSIEKKFSSVRTLGYYAKKDNGSKYQKWHEEWCRPVLTKAADGSDSHVADALYRVYWLDYTVRPLGRGNATRAWGWYKYVGHHWIQSPGGTDLLLDMRRGFQRVIQSLISKIADELKYLRDDDANKQTLQFKQEKLSKLINCLNKKGFQETILKVAGDNFYENDRDFVEKIDTNYRLMGTSNGVIECGTKEAFFRDGKPEDYITKYTPVRYNPMLTWKSRRVRQSIKWFQQCFAIDKELIEFFLRLGASFLRSRNTDKIFVVFSGQDGNNSKSLIKMAFDAVFGPHYSVTIDESVLTETGKTSGPSPEIAAAAGAKIIWFVEPDEDAALKNNKIKKYSGGDVFFARNCNENGGAIIPTFVPIIMCNKVPIIPKNEKAVEERLRVVPFVSTWSDNAPEDEEEQFVTRTFPRDRDFNEQIPRLAPGILWAFVQKYADYAKHGLSIPKVVMDFTQAYWDETDPYSIFRKECIEYVLLENSVTPEYPLGRANPSVSVAVSDVYQAYIAWFQDNYPNVRNLPSRGNVISEFSRRWKQKPVEGRWRGLQLVQNTAEVYS